ncbi:TetR/AcrR family transcriptional regulator [Kribbella sp. NPDC049584]|uniref:TetR/AcrR family transcriptional regulator n=1 Tax=Kribbella sp. NPDC049584 TaxID=3154833 RepID=UPI00341BAFED
MPTQTRRERAREERRTLILRAARDLAESEGWDAVTTRRLAEAVDYSQPVLYGHFKNMDAIADAVALEGIAELTEVFRAARSSATDDTAGLRALAYAYLEYADQHPAVYEAMFVRRTDLQFGAADTPPALTDAFNQIRAAVEPFATDDPESLTEVFWSALHGIATLTHGRRLRPTHRQARLQTLVSRFIGNK